MAQRAVVLSSGGIDSTTCIGIAIDRFGAENVATVSFYYGQKHDKELECAKRIAKYYGLPHKVIDISGTGIYDCSGCVLLKQSNKDVPEGAYIDQIDRDPNGMVSTYVPFRNGLILSAVSALALSLYPNDEIWIYLGNHADDVAGNAYADCSPEFTEAMQDAIFFGTYGKVHVASPLVHLTKAQVVKRGLDLKVPYELTWSCYKGGDKPCGKCGTCIDRAKAFEINGVKDPAIKEE